MSLDLNKDTIINVVGGSLMAFLFYGYIEGAATQKTIITKQEQVIREQKDLWNKYNDEAMYKIEFMKEYYNDKVNEEKKWKEYWKEKYKEK